MRVCIREQFTQRRGGKKHFGQRRALEIEAEIGHQVENIAPALTAQMLTYLLK